MALVNEILAGRYNAGLQGLLAMRGPNPAPQLSPDIQANIILENDRAESQLLQETLRWSGGLLQAASVGNLSFSGVTMAANTQKLAVVEGVIISSNTGGFAELRIATNVTQDTLGACQAIDNGDQTNATLNTFIRVQAATTGTTLGTFAIPANGNVVIPLRAVLRGSFPNATSIFAATVAANLAIATLWWGYERALESTEHA